MEVQSYRSHQGAKDVLPAIWCLGHFVSRRPITAEPIGLSGKFPQQEPFQENHDLNLDPEPQKVSSELVRSDDPETTKVKVIFRSRDFDASQ